MNGRGVVENDDDKEDDDCGFSGFSGFRGSGLLMAAAVTPMIDGGRMDDVVRSKSRKERRIGLLSWFLAISDVFFFFN